MKLITYLTPGATLKNTTQTAYRAQTASGGYEGEILREAQYQNLYSSIIRFRRIGETAWHWRGVETDGHNVWYWDIEPDADGNVLAPGALLKHGDLPGFEHGPAYEYMIEQFVPLPVESPDWLVKLESDEIDDVAKWRAKLMPAMANR